MFSLSGVGMQVVLEWISLSYAVCLDKGRQEAIQCDAEEDEIFQRRIEQASMSPQQPICLWKLCKR